MVRKALTTDVPQMIALAAKKREEYEEFAPTFWHRSQDAAEKQTAFFHAQLTRANTLCLVCEHAGQLDGSLIAGITTAPPVYDPGSLVCIVDDYTVADPAQWATVGKQLLEEARRLARCQGADLTVVVCGHRDESKRRMLEAAGLYIASDDRATGRYFGTGYSV